MSRSSIPIGRSVRAGSPGALSACSCLHRSLRFRDDSRRKSGLSVGMSRDAVFPAWRKPDRARNRDRGAHLKPIRRPGAPQFILRARSPQACCLPRSAPRSGYFLTPRIASLAAFATRNLTTVLAGILIFCCVFGLIPIRAFLFCFTSFPKPGSINSPSFLIAL
jgi:hypothetical protein